MVGWRDGISAAGSDGGGHSAGGRGGEGEFRGRHVGGWGGGVGEWSVSAGGEEGVAGAVKGLGVVFDFELLTLHVLLSLRSFWL